MNEDPTISQRWNPMLANADDDFANFLDFGDLNFSPFPDDITNLQPNGVGAAQDGQGAMDQTMQGTAEAMGLDRRSEMAYHAQQSLQRAFPVNGFQDTYNTEPNQMVQPRHSQAGMQHLQWQSSNMVPPTPNSMELQAGQLQSYTGGPSHQQQQRMYEHYRRPQKSQVNFTPLISPAVTPLETQLQYADGLNDAFSPLTSPALRAQSRASHSSMYGSVRGSDTSTTTSPLDLTHDYGAPTSVSRPGSVRRSRRKMSSGSTKTPARSVKQSPAMKPQHKKKQTSSLVIPPKEVATILEQASHNAGTSSISARSDGKVTAPEQPGTDPVSPESLSEILMPPPATPQSSSAGRSPNLNTMQSALQTDADKVEEPATPASLMRLRQQAEKQATRKREAPQVEEQAAATEASIEQITEDVALPEPATARGKRSIVRSINTSQANAKESPADKEQFSGRSRAPVTAPASTFASPSIMAINNGPGPRKGADAKRKGREPKKRTSTNSEKVSPALRPKISPSVKPLLPEGTTVSPETSALLLASKSNYQNILEGTHFPGVSYPETLSTNLTSKRTSHKLAEQGRRNRINTALQEIALLLPPTSPPTLAAHGSRPAASSPSAGGGGGGNEGTQTGEDRAASMMSASSTPQQQSNSKASTVEAAIDYIKSLQKEVRECRDKIAEYEKHNASGVGGWAEQMVEDSGVKGG